MNIPKIIHYCWFGNNKHSERVIKCIASWRKYCPDYEIKEWNEQNYDVNKVSYIRDAYKEKKWAFVTDYARLDVIWQYGGFYLDTDVELIKPLDFFRDKEVFFTIEKKNTCIATGLGFGAVPHNEKVRQLMDIYHKLSFYNEDGSLNLIATPKYTTAYFATKGYQNKDITQKCEEAVIFSSEFFCPMQYDTGELIITENTYGIHWYESSWLPESDKKIRKTELWIKQKCKNNIVLAKWLCMLYRNGYRFFEYLGKGILLEKVKRKMKYRIN